MAPEDTTGATVGLIFAGIGAAVIAVGMFYITKDACYSLFCECGGSRSSTPEGEWWAANGSMSNVENLTPEQLKRLRSRFLIFAEPSGTITRLLSHAELHLANYSSLSGALDRPLGYSLFDALEFRERQRLFVVADRRGCGRVNFDDFCHILVRIQVEGAKAVAQQQQPVEPPPGTV